MQCARSARAVLVSASGGVYVCLYVRVHLCMYLRLYLHVHTREAEASGRVNEA